MGKHKSKKRHRSDSSSSSSSSSSDEDDREKKRAEIKDKKKHKKSKDQDKKSSKSRSKDELVRQARAFLEQQLASGGGDGGGGGAPVVGTGPPSSDPMCGRGAPVGAGPLPPVQVSDVPESLSDDDYFRRHAEFAAFLAEERRTAFNELSSDRARELFSEFVHIWNEGRLAPRYYAGLVAAPKRRTEYRWAFRGAAAGGAGISSGPTGGRGGGAAAAAGMAAFLEDQRAQQVVSRQTARAADRGRVWELLEEVAPRETGRDKMVAERAARRQLARAGDDEGPGGFVPGGGRGGEDELMGGGDSFEAAKAREARRAEGARQRGVVRTEETAQRAAAYAAREEEKLAGLRALLAQGPITIPKRT